MERKCDCSKSLKRITTLFATWQRALQTSGVLYEEKSTGKRKGRRKTGGFQSRGRRTLRRSQERRERTNVTTSPPRAPTTSPSITSYFASDDPRDDVFMRVIEEDDDLPDLIGGGDDLPDLIEEGDVLPDLEGPECIGRAGPASQLAVFQRGNYPAHSLNYAKCKQKTGEFRSAKQQPRPPEVADRPLGNVMHETPTRFSPPGRRKQVANFRWERSSQKDVTPSGHNWHSPARKLSGGSRWPRAEQSFEGSLCASQTNAKIFDEELWTMDWFYDDISGQHAVELLIEFGQPGNFIIRNSEKMGQFNMIWLVRGQEIKSEMILIKEGVCLLASDTRIFNSLQSLIGFYMENSNLLSAPLENKEMHRKNSQQRQFKQRTERLVYCWFCSAFHNKIHFCSALSRWRQINLNNFLIIEGPSRSSVERYGDYVYSDCNENCKVSLYISKVKMNQEECSKANDYRAEKKLKAEKEKEEDDANKWWEENNKRFQNMNVKDCHVFLERDFPRNNDVRPGVYWILLAKLRKWKGDPPPTPPPPRPQSPWWRRENCSEFCHKDERGKVTHSTSCKKWKWQECNAHCTKTQCVTYCPRYSRFMHWTKMPD